MAKTTTRYVCQDCGTWHPKWGGKCEGCGAWNRLVEEQVESKRSTTRPSPVEFVGISGETPLAPRKLTNISEFDRVCGGGVVPGSVLLVGGDPGIGKSTLLLQVVAALARQVPCAYISGEEAIAQIRLRAQRLGVEGGSQLHLASATNVKDILNALDQFGNIELVVIDSIQTMVTDTIESAPGTVSQVRTCAQELIIAAKKRNTVVVLVGHVTKEGVLAGPRVLEHMVDTVLYFEGESNYQYRILRSVKNRYGATDEIGVFEMTDRGLSEVSNPSALFLNDHNQDVSGSAIFAGIEGTRPILTEIQALVAPTYLASPRRTAVGWDAGRLSMILAVLEARCGLIFGNKDVYLNVAGGLKVTEPAADLAVAAALVSALVNVPIPSQSVFFGEIGLAGEVRPVAQAENRLKEAAKLGFLRAYCALPSQQKATRGKEGIESVYVMKYLIELLDLLPKLPHNKAKSIER
ncbi:MAG: DNA repair protein RadA [Alphaproteobacteria bacterium]|nr:DNA repair protein RadA [Alphaproteobacteria bacterium]